MLKVVFFVFIWRTKITLSLKFYTTGGNGGSYKYEVWPA